MIDAIFNWLKKRKKTNGACAEKKLRNLLLYDKLSFIMSVASDENRGRNIPKDLQEMALSMILSRDEDIAFFAIDACAVRMHLPESFPLILERLHEENSAYVLFSMCSGVFVLGKRGLIDKRVAVDTLHNICTKLTNIEDNESIQHCSECLEKLETLVKK